MTLHRRGNLATPPRRDGENEAIIGKVSPMNTTGVAPNLAVRPTQLIAARHVEPRQWVVTLMQPTQQVRQVSPWLSTFDGTGTTPDNSLGATRNFSAPTFPLGSSGSANVLQVSINWGAGGAKFETAFDYPAGGKVFGITADQLELSVQTKAVTTTTVYASADLVPVVGAFMVEGVVTDPTPLRWMEPTATIADNSGVFYAVKPYARKLHVDVRTAGAYTIIWSNASMGQVWAQDIATTFDGKSFVLDIPANAEVVNITNNTGANAVIQAEWFIGLT